MNQWKKIKKWLYDHTPRHSRWIYNEKGLIGTTAAIIGGTLAVGAGVAAGSAAQSASKRAKSEAEQQARLQMSESERLQAERAEEVAFQRELAAPRKEFQERQLALFKDVFDPQLRAFAPRIQQQLDQPLSLPQEVFDELFQRGRERIGREFGVLEEKTTQRLAGAGPGVLRGGQAQQLFGEIERERVRSVEDLAIDQAIFEFQEKKIAQQQAFENAFRFIGGAPTIGQAQVPSIPSAPGFIPPPIPEASSGLSEGLSTALRVASLFSGSFAGGGASAGTSSTGAIAESMGGAERFGFGEGALSLIP